MGLLFVFWGWDMCRVVFIYLEIWLLGIQKGVLVGGRNLRLI